MRNLLSKNLLIAVFALIWGWVPRVQAQVYVEADPFAYALSGHSLHLGLQGAGLRLQVGTFGAELPDGMKDNEAFLVKQSGYGLKLDYYGHKPEGGFVGIEYGETTADYRLKSTDESIERDVNLLGIRFGYKWKMSDSFYAMPWVGVDKNITQQDLEFELGGETYTEQEWTVFPTVHLGYDF